MHKKLVKIIVITIPFLFFALSILYSSRNKWDEYYKKSASLPPNKLLVANFPFINRNGTKIALDLGSGTGNDTAFLLNKGWKVIAIDSEPRAIKTLNDRSDIKNSKSNLTNKLARFEDINWNELPKVNLVVASYSLPFCSRNHFPQVWINLSKKIAPGGYFVGEFFGNDYSGFTEKDRNNMTFLDKTQVLKLFDGFKIQGYKEIKEISKTRVGNVVHSHIFEVIAKKADQ